MDIEIREDGRILYRDGNKEYKFINMGEYVGYTTRDWYEEAPECYRLMAYNETQEDGILHIEALIDSLGDYSRLIVKKGSEERVIALSGKHVLEDVVYVMEDDEIIPKDRYVALENDFEHRRNIEDYFDNEHTFRSSKGEKYTGEVIKDAYVINFIRKNAELSHTVKHSDEGEMKM